MKLRTTVFLWVLLLVVAVLGATIGTIVVVFDRSTRQRLADESVRSREVARDLHADRESLHRQECRVVAEEPRLKAVVATEDVAQETIFDAVRTLATTLNAGVFVLVDADGRLIADMADPAASGFDLSDRPVVKTALKDGEASGVWIADDRAYQVSSCRLEFGSRIVGALVIGHAIDDAFADTAARHTGGSLVVTLDGKALTLKPASVAVGEIAPALDAIRGGAREVSLGGEAFFAQVVPVPGYAGEHTLDYLLLRSIDEALSPARKVIRIMFLVVGGAALATLILALGLARRLSRPIDALVTRTAAIAHGDLSPHPVNGPTEVQALGHAMDRMAKEIDESRIALADKERLARELEIAARIQTSILPRNLEVPRLQMAAKMLTATEVGGDYYDVLPVEDGCWIAIGDASGHGLTAGLVMMMVQTGVATLVAANPNTSPRDVLKSLNHVLYENVHDRLEAERHMTLSLLRYRTDGTIVVAGAHMDAVVWRKATGTTELLGTPGTFLAIAQDIDAVNQEVTWSVSAGDILVLLTDGVTEAENAAGKPFEYERVTALVEAHATEPVAAIRDSLFRGLETHSPTLADDATILVLRYVASGDADT
jgi:sigma-B regulation protein RsbU (phosphoserine phosphatase)